MFQPRYGGKGLPEDGMRRLGRELSYESDATGVRIESGIDERTLETTFAEEIPLFGRLHAGKGEE